MNLKIRQRKKITAFGFVLTLVFVLMWIPSVRIFPAQLPSHIVLILPLTLMVIAGYSAGWWKSLARVPGFEAVVGGTGCLLIWALATAVWSVEGYRVFRVAYALGSGLAFALAIALVCQDGQTLIQLYYRFVFISAAWIIVLAVIRWVPASESIIIAIGGPRGLEDLDEKDRFAGFFKHSNQYGIALSSTLASIFAATLSPVKGRRFATIIIMLAVPAVCLAVFLTGSKTNILLLALVAMAVGFRFALSSRNASRMAGRLITLTIVLVTLGIVGVTTLEVVNPRALLLLTNFFTEGIQSVQSLRAREMIWDESIAIGLDHPLLGVGAGSRILGYAHSHNVLIDYFRGMGFPGLILGFVILFGIFNAAARGYFGAIKVGRFQANIAAVLTGSGVGVSIYVVSNMTSESFGPSTILFLFGNLGFLFAALRFVDLSGWVRFSKVRIKWKQPPQIAKVR